jgi:hypothetical protein
MDITDTIIPKSDQLNADDLIAGPRVIRIAEIKRKSEPQQPLAIHFDGDNGKPWKPCLSMRRALVHVWGSDATKWIGRTVKLALDKEVVYGGKKVGGIRIREMSDIPEPLTFMLTDKRGSRSPYTVHPLQDPLAGLEAAARQGSDAFRAAWKASDKATRDLAAARVEEFQKIATAADSSAPKQ